MPLSLNIDEFLERAHNGCIVDVRTPKEFESGHIPGAINFPLFSNEERVIVGTIYKQEGKQPAISKGLEFVGPRMAEIVSKLSALAKDNTLFMHCWRGGMRSGSVAWLMELYGVKVFTLKGGYKFFRRFVLSSFEKKYSLTILGGRTGAGKTRMLEKLSKKNEQVIDLEKLAHHKGSSFGALGEEQQPTQEQFENKLAMLLKNMNTQQQIWLEDESRLIGTKVIPTGLWVQMRTTKLVYLNVVFEERVQNLVEEYGKFSKEKLRESVARIGKRLGPQHVKAALIALDADDLKTTCEICLKYYDKAYDNGMSQREKQNIIQVDWDEEKKDALIETLMSIKTE